MHHIIPCWVLKNLKKSVRDQVKGKKGAPNRVFLDNARHRELHSGSSGGAKRGGQYNKFWHDEIMRAEGFEKIKAPTIFDIAQKARRHFGF